MSFPLVIWMVSLTLVTSATRYRRLQGTSFLAPTILGEVSADSGIGNCAVQCVATQGCHSVQIKTSENVCHLMEDRIVSSALMSSHNEILLVEIQDGNIEDRVLLLHATSGLGKSVADFWVDTTFTGGGWNGDVTNPELPAAQYFKSSLVEKWETLNHKKVELLFYRQNVTVVRLVFSAVGTSKVSWFSYDRLLESSFGDLPSLVQSSCGSECFASIQGPPANLGQGGEQRKFYLSYNWAGCASDNGWMLVMESGPPSDACSYANTWATSAPAFAYATSGRVSKFAVPGNFSLADTMAIFAYI